MFVESLGSSHDTRSCTTDTLQQWAAELLDCEPGLEPWADGLDIGQSIELQASSSVDPVLSPLNRRPSLYTEPTYRPFLTHYQDCLSRLVACNPDDATNGFDAFTTLAAATATTVTGRALHLATLAWAGVHMSNQGQSKYEARSERAAEEAKNLLFSDLIGTSPMPVTTVVRFDKLSILGGLLMLMSFKVCGPASNQKLADHTNRYAEAIYGVTEPYPNG